MIDIHTHILPELDDGSRNVEESIKMLDIMSKQGVETVVATPHFVIDSISPAEFLEQRHRSAEKLKKALEKVEKRPQIVLGAEVQFYPELHSLEGIEDFCLGKSRYILVEMPFAPWTGYIYQALSKLSMSRGITPIIAHIERYFDFINESEAILRLREAGVLIQMNSSYIIDKLTRRKALSLIKKGAVNFLGSDCHNVEYRVPNIDQAYEIILKKFGQHGIDGIRYREEQLMKSIEILK